MWLGADGSLHIRSSYYCNGADIAERTLTVEPLEPGEVVSLDETQEGKLRKSRGAYENTVAGVVSTNPGIILNSGDNPDISADGQTLEQIDAAGSRTEPVVVDGVPLALAGRAPVRVTTENGSIRVGDILVSSSRPGYAMRGDREIIISTPGVSIGKAMESLDEGEGTILVLVNL
ncbi:hypothetical protein AUK40_05805 [Candidatus Wirthbacteria bacterium CG2_30_54_11]|uniref:Uncharacterized protein n=1 Tax=Candidatus Wirthbacteria bacterium CG2_30_54_11 TaxID=1817892 RepID=A0A1J5ITT3_9BACT|nr:MAG: hypothetical protein AUK40_05805 [Candidatus Wirthbacteria bacterium CG2_30_54_11]